MTPAPLRLAPVFVPRIWGARSLAPLFEDSCQQAIGEVWLSGEACTFLPGPDAGVLAGRSLGEVWKTLPVEWTGTQLRGSPRIPLLGKFIFSEDKLSVQVHPEGKTEMWYVIAARDGAEVLVGLEPGVTEKSLRLAVDDGTAERCLTRYRAHEGDAFFVPAGTVHTIGAGLVLCEIQQHSDITYRMYDYNRVQADGTRRQLHLREAMEVANFGEQKGGRVVPFQTRRGALESSLLAACPYFATERWEFSERIPAETSAESLELLIMLSGSGRLHWRTRSAQYECAQAWFLPAGLGPYELAPETTTRLIRTYVPDLKGSSQ